MAYTITYPFFAKQHGCHYVNRSLEVFCSAAEIVESSEDFVEWYEKNRYNYEHVLDAIEEYTDTTASENLFNRFRPKSNLVHILQKKDVGKDEVAAVLRHARGISIIYIAELNCSVIAEAKNGAYLDDAIELAYYIIDGKSPVRAQRIENLSEYEENALIRMRVQQETGGYSNYKKFFFEEDE